MVGKSGPLTALESSVVLNTTTGRLWYARMLAAVGTPFDVYSNEIFRNLPAPSAPIVETIELIGPPTLPPKLSAGWLDWIAKDPFGFTLRKMPDEAAKR